MQSVANNSSKLVYITCQCKTNEKLPQVPSITFCLIHPTSHYSHSTSISTSQRLQGMFYLFLQIFFQNTTCKPPKLLNTLLTMCHTSVCFWALSKLDESLREFQALHNGINSLNSLLSYTNQSYMQTITEFEHCSSSPTETC